MILNRMVCPAEKPNCFYFIFHQQDMITKKKDVEMM